MPILVDGNNMAGRLGANGAGSESDRSELLRALASRLRKSKARVTVVFDGMAPSGRETLSLGGLTVSYAGRRSADDDLVAQVTRSRAPSEWIVVTDDRELTRRVRDAGGKTEAVVEFWDRFGETSTSEVDKRPPAAEDWLQYFSDDRNRNL